MVTLRKISLILAALVLVASVRCNIKPDAATIQLDTATIQLDAATQSERGGLQVPDQVKTNCYICHNPNAPSHDAIIAPPLAAVKVRYNRQYQTQEEFVQNMTAFLINPTKEQALMYGAVDRFGIMGKSFLDVKTIREIAEYIYNNKLEEPPWLKEEMGNRGM